MSKVTKHWKESAKKVGKLMLIGLAKFTVFFIWIAAKIIELLLQKLNRVMHDYLFPDKK